MAKKTTSRNISSSPPVFSELFSPNTMFLLAVMNMFCGQKLKIDDNKLLSNDLLDFDFGATPSFG